ncbi:hypothetical protein GCM10011498_17480 [Amylibacter cionae]|uniref:Uncharacterized protein n=1 Tax=Neptunicoccus cionae TaxID=2035344 RepID=A0A916QW49_9RHOB|nr:hypothetical protein GCM10011498_17480 [Amylibacter cionae]
MPPPMIRCFAACCAIVPSDEGLTPVTVININIMATILLIFVDILRKINKCGLSFGWFPGIGVANVEI